MTWRPPEFASHPEAFDAPTWRAFCHAVVDGDTYTMLIDQGFLAYTYQRIRLRGLDCPEMTGPDAARGKAAKEAATALLLNRPAVLTVHHDERSLERWVADVLWWTGTRWEHVADTLRSAGHVK